MGYQVVKASEEQKQKIFNKYLSKKLKIKDISYDQDDNIFFFTLKPIKERIITFQIRRERVCYFTLLTEHIRYDIDFPKDEIADKLLNIGKKRIESFWKGSML